MNSYIEVTFFINLLCSLMSYYLSGYFTFSKKKMKIYYFLVGMEQCLHILLFNPDYYFIFYLYESFFYLYMFYENGRKCIVYISSKYLILILLWKYYGGSFHLFHYYPNIYFHFIIIGFVLIILTYLLKCKWSYYLKVSDFIYDVYIYCDHPFCIKGLLDTGNNVCIDGIPVIFVDISFNKCFQSIPHTYFNTCTIDTIKNRKAYLCKVYIKGYKKAHYYICCDESIVLEYNCKCLLNMEG